jgi:membrane protein
MISHVGVGWTIEETVPAAPARETALALVRGARGYARVMVAMAADERSGRLGPRELGSTLRDAASVARRNGVGDSASVIAYNGVIALPAVLLTTLGLLVALGGQQAVDGLLSRAASVLPPDALSLMRGTLYRAVDHRSSGVVFAALGIGFAVWSAMGAMGAVMRGLNRAYHVEESRRTVRRLGTAFVMLALTVVAACLTAGLLALGPVLAAWLGRVTGHPDATRVIWWSAQWPLTLAGLAVAVAGMLAIGPDTGRQPWRVVGGGALVAVAAWIALSLLLALYVAHFGSYNKAWGSLSAIVVTIVWMRLSALALLFGAEVDAAVERRKKR